MVRVRTLRLLLPRWVREFPRDLAAVLVLVGLTWASVGVPVLRESVVRTIVGALFVLFVPGYALVAALFPDADVSGDGNGLGDGTGSGGTDDHGRGDERPVDGHAEPPALDRDRHAEPPALDCDRHGEPPALDRDRHAEPRATDSGGRSVDSLERVVLSVGFSVLLVPTTAFLLNFTAFGVAFVPTMTALSGLTVALTAVAAVRRWRVPAGRRFEAPVGRWLAAGRSRVSGAELSAEYLLDAVIAGAVLVALVSASYAVVAPNEEGFTELSLLTRNGTGDLVASDYPTEFAAGESRPIVIGVDNHETERVDYSVVVELQRVDAGNGSRRVIEERELDRLRIDLRPNETWRHGYEVVPPLTGDRLRLQFLLYRGPPPDEPGGATAYRRVHLWINVSTGGAPNGE